MGVPFGHWRTTTFIAGLASWGMVAPFVMNGPVSCVAFETYIERVLIPELRPGDVVIMDNLSNHKGDRTRHLIEQVGTELRFLPSYRPDFNPIEKNAFAKLKACLRKAAARTVGALWDTIGTISTTYSPNECASFFSAAGCDTDR